MIDPISSVALNPATTSGGALTPSQESSLSTSWTNETQTLQIRATDMAPSSKPGPFSSDAINNLSSSVRSGLEDFKSDNSNAPLKAQNDIVDENKNTMAPTFDKSGESASITENKDPMKDAFVVLEKTFDHAIFSAMVTQVASGVSNSVRMLARQS